MQIWAYWEDCELLHGKWEKEGVTSYWVEAGPDELDKVSPYFEDRASLLVDIQRHRRRESADEHFYLLVSKNLESIKVMPFVYPLSSMWGAYCPFRAIGPIAIADLKEITEIDEAALEPIAIDLADFIPWRK